MNQYYAYIIKIENNGNVHSCIIPNEKESGNFKSLVYMGTYEQCERALDNELKRLGVPEIKNNVSLGCF